MKYAKPEIVALGRANVAIQGEKEVGVPDHKRIPDVYQTVAAYQADE